MTALMRMSVFVSFLVIFLNSSNVAAVTPSYPTFRVDFGLSCRLLAKRYLKKIGREFNVVPASDVVGGVGGSDLRAIDQEKFFDMINYLVFLEDGQTFVYRRFDERASPSNPYSPVEGRFQMVLLGNGQIYASNEFVLAHDFTRPLAGYFMALFVEGKLVRLSVLHYPRQYSQVSRETMLRSLVSEFKRRGLLMKDLTVPASANLPPWNVGYSEPMVALSDKEVVPLRNFSDEKN